jgi:signal transduction histidine kinase
MQRSLGAETAFLRRIQGDLARLAVAAVLMALIAGLLIADGISRPIQKLVRGAEEMERGNYDFPLVLRGGHDEIGYLAERFVEMRRHERRYVTSLEEVARWKSKFIDVTSHELRTPIAVIKGFHELLTDGALGPLNAKQKNALVAIEESVSGLERISEDATRVAQIEGERLILNPQPHALRDVVEDATARASNDAPKRRIDLTLQIDADAGTAVIDGPRMVQAVANLVRNGIRFTPDGGAVNVRAGRDDDGLVIEVQDTGVGIEADRIPELFGQAFTVRDTTHHHSSGALEFNSAGLGLGLSIACGIVAAHGGTITVASAPGEGSTFTIRVPEVDSIELRRAA